MSKTDNLIKFEANGLKRVGVSESFTVPAVRSRSAAAVLLYGSALDTVLNVGGGQIFACYTDAAQATPEQSTLDLSWRLEPGDVVTCSAVGATVAGKIDVKVNGQLIFQITATAVGGVLLVTR